VKYASTRSGDTNVEFDVDGGTVHYRSIMRGIMLAFHVYLHTI